jgi:molybdopterin-containing oxidoreductase family membrane subunit
MYSHVPELTEDFQNLYLGTLGHTSLLPWGRTSLVLMAVALLLLLMPATRRNNRLLAAACVVTFISLWVDKGICVVVSGFMPSPLRGRTAYIPTLPELLISLAIWAVGALMITIFYKITLSVRDGAETWSEERTLTPLPASE